MWTLYRFLLKITYVVPSFVVTGVFMQWIQRQRDHFHSPATANMNGSFQTYLVYCGGLPCDIAVRLMPPDDKSAWVHVMDDTELLPEPTLTTLYDDSYGVKGANESKKLISYAS